MTECLELLTADTAMIGSLSENCVHFSACDEISKRLRVLIGSFIEHETPEPCRVRSALELKHPLDGAHDYHHKPNSGNHQSLIRIGTSGSIRMNSLFMDLSFMVDDLLAPSRARRAANAAALAASDQAMIDHLFKGLGVRTQSFIVPRSNAHLGIPSLKIPHPCAYCSPNLWIIG